MPAPANLSPGDKVRWTDNDAEEPVERVGTVTAVLNRMVLILPQGSSVEKFVYRDDASLRRYSE